METILSNYHACQLDKYNPIPCVNFSSLSVLDLSWNSFFYSTFDWFRSLTSLVTLDLSFNQIQVPLQAAFQNMPSLRNLYLTANNFSYTMPKWLYNLSALERLDLSHNHIQGNFSTCKVKNLEILNLARNHFSGSLPDQLGRIQKLSILSLHFNLLSGPISLSIGKLSSLRVLSLFNNQLNGTIPVSFGHLSNLEHLDISHNLLEGFVSDMHLSNLTSLKQFLASSYLLTLQNCKTLELLDFNDNNFSSEIPIWLGNSSANLVVLMLRSNKFRGDVPQELCQLKVLQILDLAQNKISGSILRRHQLASAASSRVSANLPPLNPGVFSLFRFSRFS
ncbi:hypothetical protein SLA2020_276440 [Shorea laevis]